jgi:hypothetical protein
VKLDMELARSLLAQIADDDLQNDRWDQSAIYHLKMLTDVGYVEGVKFLQTNSGELHYGLINAQLTWHGHEFLDTIRPKGVWEKIKDVAKEKGVGLTVESITKIGASVVGALLTAQPA